MQKCFDPRMSQFFEKDAFSLVVPSKDDFGNLSAIYVPLRIKDFIAPTLPQFGNDFWLAKHIVTSLIGVENEGSHIAQDVRDKAFATGNSADEAKDEHKVRGAGF